MFVLFALLILFFLHESGDFYSQVLHLLELVFSVLVVRGHLLKKVVERLRLDALGLKPLSVFLFLFFLVLCD